VAGGLDGVGGPVVLAGLPDDRVAVVLTGVVDGHPDPEGEGGLALLGVVVAEAMRASAGTPNSGLSRSKARSAARSRSEWSWAWFLSRWFSSWARSGLPLGQART
jgi:hypothetical protein